MVATIQDIPSIETSWDSNKEGSQPKESTFPATMATSTSVHFPHWHFLLNIVGDQAGSEAFWAYVIILDIAF